MNDKITPVIALVALVLGAFGSWQWYASQPHFPAKFFGETTGASGVLVENYVPAIMYANGYNSAKDINTTADVFAAILTGSSNLSVGTTSTSALISAGNGNATTTIDFGKACFRFVNANNQPVYMYPSPSNIAGNGNQYGIIFATSSTSCF